MSTITLHYLFCTFNISKKMEICVSDEISNSYEAFKVPPDFQ